MKRADTSRPPVATVFLLIPSAFPLWDVDLSNGHINGNKLMAMRKEKS